MLRNDASARSAASVHVCSPKTSQPPASAHIACNELECFLTEIEVDRFVNASRVASDRRRPTSAMSYRHNAGHALPQP